MVTILYHRRSNGGICHRIANASDGGVRAISDQTSLGHVRGTLVRWDSIAQVIADRVINSAESVKFSRNKRDSRWLLGELAPPTWIHSAQCTFPCVVRPARHFGGHDFHLCHNRVELLAAIRHCGTWYASPLIVKDSEYRIFVLNGEAYKIVRHYREDGDPNVPWNHHAGGSARRITREHWPQGIANVAVQAASRLHLDFCAVDVMVQGANQYVLECNTAPGLERPSTIARLAERFMEYDRRPAS